MCIKISVHVKQQHIQSFNSEIKATKRPIQENCNSIYCFSSSENKSDGLTQILCGISADNITFLCLVCAYKFTPSAQRL